MSRDISLVERIYQVIAETKAAANVYCHLHAQGYWRCCPALFYIYVLLLDPLSESYSIILYYTTSVRPSYIFYSKRYVNDSIRTLHTNSSTPQCTYIMNWMTRNTRKPKIVIKQTRTHNKNIYFLENSTRNIRYSTINLNHIKQSYIFE